MLQNQVSNIEEQVGVYQTVKSSLMKDLPMIDSPDLSCIEFYSDHSIKLCDIHSTYIDQLLGTYAANSSDIREEIEKALKKTKVVKEAYHQILDAIDIGDIDADEGILSSNDNFLLQRETN